MRWSRVSYATVELQEALKTLGKKVSRGRGMVKVELDQKRFPIGFLTSCVFMSSRTFTAKIRIAE